MELSGSCLHGAFETLSSNSRVHVHMVGMKGERKRREGRREREGAWDGEATPKENLKLCQTTCLRCAYLRKDLTKMLTRAEEMTRWLRALAVS